MTLTRKIAHNTIIQIIGKAASTLLGLIAIGLMTRYLGQTGFGQYTTIIAFLQFFGVLADMGLYIILVKKISEPEADIDNIVSNIFTLRLISAIIFLGLAPLVVLFFPYPSIVKTGVALTTFSIFFITLNQVLIGIFQKNLRMDKVAIAEIVGRIALIGATLSAIALKLNLLAIMVAVVLGSFTNFLMTFIFSRKYVRIKLKFNFKIWKNIIKQTWPIALSIAFNLIYFKADTIILSIVKTQADVGIYGATYKILEVLTTFPAMFAGLMLPLLAAAYTQANLEKFKKILQKAFDLMIIMVLPLIVVVLFFAKPIMILIGGSEFEASGTVLKIIIFATASIFIGNLFGNTIVAINKQKTMMWFYLGIALFALTGYLIFIPRYSYFGAAGMTVASEIAIMLSSAWIVFRTTKVRLGFQIFLKSLLASLIMALGILILLKLNIILVIIIGIIIYFLILYLLKGFTKEIVKEITSSRQS